MATLKISSDLEKVIKKVVLDTYYPIGKLYLSVGNEDPNQTIGGTWTKLSGYYLYADTSINNTSYTGKHTQGHKLTKAQSGLPKHGHTLRKNTPYGMPYNDTGGAGSGGNGPFYRESYSPFTLLDNDGFDASEEHAHNIATKGIYVWQRTA